MSEHMNIKTFIERFDKGDFVSQSVSKQCEAGWYDWFCKKEKLAGKTAKLTAKLKTILKSAKIDTETQYVFFKNNCPMSGPTYDDFRICDIETGDLIYTIVPKCTHSGMAEVWGRENGAFDRIVQGTWTDVKKYFNS
jgi:hypothetical protein